MTSTSPTPDARERMCQATALIQHLLSAAGIDPKEQVIDLVFLQAVYEAPAATRAALAELVAAHAQIDSQLLTVDQVAQRLRVKPKLIRKLAKWGALHGLQARDGWRFTERAFSEFVEQQTFQGNLRVAELETWRAAE